MRSRFRARVCALVLAATGCVALGGEAEAGLVGLSTETSSYYSVDPLTGTATFISASDASASLVGLSFISDTLFASDIFNVPGHDGAAVVQVNLATGGSSFVSDQGGSVNWHGLASNQVTGLLYSIDFDDDFILKSLDPTTGTITPIGTGTGIIGAGMEYADSTATLYATGNDTTTDLYTVDVATGTASLIGSTGLFSNATGLAFDETSGTLYMTARPEGEEASNLYQLNTATGAATLIGSTGVAELDGLAWTGDATAVPEPSTLVLLGAGLIGVGMNIRRRIGASKSRR